jgi:hypothetical protein
LLDLFDAAVKELIRSAKKGGYVTVDQINSVLPSKEAHSEQIKDILSMFGEMGVNVVETKEADPQEEAATREEPDEEAGGENELVEVPQCAVPAKSGAREPLEGSTGSGAGDSALRFGPACWFGDSSAALRFTTLLRCEIACIAINSPVMASTKESTRMTLRSTTNSSLAPGETACFRCPGANLPIAETV